MSPPTCPTCGGPTVWLYVDGGREAIQCDACERRTRDEADAKPPGRVWPDPILTMGRVQLALRDVKRHSMTEAAVNACLQRVLDILNEHHPPFVRQEFTQ